MKIEICAGNIEDIIIANNFKNIARIELNQGLSTGGLTPSFSLVKNALKLSKHKIIVMIRLREGSFSYTENEFNIMYDDAKTFLELGVDGIVFGFLDNNLDIDINKTKKMIELAHKYKKEAIFHRAIDVTSDYIKSIKNLKNMNIDRILTSGHEMNAIIGLDNLIKAKKIFDKILPGSGINQKNLEEFKKKGFLEVHGSFSKSIKNEYIIDFGTYTKTSENIINSLTL